ncbi:dUTP diphosphatase [Bacillus sp. FH]|uniref:dUTP diphosphatase n=1 Tax=Bacillus sp. FH TaxID=3456953 RepID=UPI003FA41A7D
MNLRVKIKRVKDVELPRYAKPGDSGFDLVAAEDTIIEPGQTKVIPTGLAFEIPPGFELQVRPRSGISRKTKLRVVQGTVDSGFRGEVGVIVDNIAIPDYTAWYTQPDGYVVAPEIEGYLLTTESNYDQLKYIGPDDTTVPLEHGYHRPNQTYIIRKGERIAQGVIAPVETVNFVEVDELSDSERGNKGFGSTGTK